MLVFGKRQQKFVSGRGIIDFINSNKDTIANIASVASSVANVAASTANAAKQIYDAVKTKRIVNNPNNALTPSSIQILNNLIN
jgi:hypothetical protein